MVTSTQLYDELKETLGKEAAEHLIQHLEARDTGRLATRENLSDTEGLIRKDLFTTEKTLRGDISKLKDDMHRDIRQLMWMLIVLLLPLYGLIIFQIMKP